MRRSSILGLMALVALLGVSAAALRYPSQLWASGLFTVAVGMVLFAIFSGVYSSGGRRAFWAGFAAFGGVYLVLTCKPLLEDPHASSLATSAAIELLYAYAAPATPSAPSPPPSPVMPQEPILEGGVDDSTSATGGVPGRRRLAILALRRSGPDPHDVWERWTSGRPKYMLPMNPGVLISAPPAYRRIGHSIFTLVIALLGGVFTRRLHAIRGSGALN
jgi:hypothetical protein